ncbi:hypothetical protein R84B8_02662 [Treponema sp. R8-4-B8]
MKNKHVAIYFTSIFILLLTLNSCIGLSLSIKMNKDGSGQLTMGYRISKMINLGALDGNESMPLIPISKADWERTINRIPGAKLASYSSVEDKRDTVIKAVIDYKDDKSLLALLDPFGEMTSINRQGQSGKLELILPNGSSDDSAYDNDLMDMMRTYLVMDGYNFSVSFSGPGNSTLAVTDGEGKVVPPQSSAKTVLSGKLVSYSIGIMDLLDNKNGLGLIFTW